MRNLIAAAKALKATRAGVNKGSHAGLVCGLKNDVSVDGDPGVAHSRMLGG